MVFRLKQLRKEKKLSQLRLAIDLDMNQNTISRYENMEREADYITLIRFADYFNVSLDYLLGRTDNKDKQNSKKDFIWFMEQKKHRLLGAFLY